MWTCVPECGVAEDESVHTFSEEATAWVGHQGFSSCIIN